jgi:hypothetical protein
MAFCVKCGADLVGGASFCGKCGSSVSPGMQGGPAGPLPPMPPASVQSVPGAGPNLITRVINILTKPQQEWHVIERESTSVADLYIKYIAILAAIPAVASFIGMAVIGWNYLGIVSVRIPMGMALLSMILGYGLSLGAVYLCAIIIDKLAPSFQSQPNFLQAIKLVTYVFTASWIAGIFSLLPALAFLTILGLYGVYLLYVGLPIMMKTPQDNVIGYMIVSAVIILVIYAIAFGLVYAIYSASYRVPGLIG